jgi:hypothetical protein
MCLPADDDGEEEDEEPAPSSGFAGLPVDDDEVSTSADAA